MEEAVRGPTSPERFRGGPVVEGQTRSGGGRRGRAGEGLGQRLREAAGMEDTYGGAVKQRGTIALPQLR